MQLAARTRLQLQHSRTARGHWRPPLRRAPAPAGTAPPPTAARKKIYKSCCCTRPRGCPGSWCWSAPATPQPPGGWSCMCQRGAGRASGGGWPGGGPGLPAARDTALHNVQQHHLTAPLPTRHPSARRHTTPACAPHAPDVAAEHHHLRIAGPDQRLAALAHPVLEQAKHLLCWQGEGGGARGSKSYQTWF